MMKSRAVRALLLVGAFAPAVAWAEDKPPPDSPSATVYVGSCLSPALNGPAGANDRDQSAFLTAVLGAAVPSLIGSGLDWIGTQLTALGADKKTTVFGTRASEAVFGNRTCVQIVRKSSGGRSVDALIAEHKGWREAEATAAAAAAAQAGGPGASWTPSAVPKQQTVDFLVEFWVRPSTGGEVVSLTPTLLYYPSQLTSKKNDQKDAAIVVAAKLEPAGETSASWTWALPRQTPTAALQALIPPLEEGGRVVRQPMGALRRLCESECEMASPWTGNPWAKKDKPAAAGGAGTGGVIGGVGPGAVGGGATQKATNVRVEVTEIRAGSEFFKALGAAFTAAKPAIKTGLEQAILPAKAEAAEATATTAKATALTAFATKLGDVDTTLKDKYCAAKGKPGANWTALSAELQAKQLLANVAADAADVPHPFPTPIPVSNAIDAGRCP